MTELEYARESSKYLDANLMLNPNKGKEYSDNGLYFSALDVLLVDRNNWYINDIWYRSLIEECFKKPGLLMRNPQNKGGVEQFDNYTGVVLGAMLTNNTDLLRTILLYAVTHGFYMNNTDTFTSKAWLGRYPMLWIYMTAACIPLTKYLLFPLIALSTLFLKPTSEDQSGNLLQYTTQSIIRKLYNIDYFFKIWDKKLNAKVQGGMAEAMRQYFGGQHPFTQVILQNNKY